MSKHSDEFLLIGLGEFGKNLAYYLIEEGFGVYGADKDEEVVDSMGQKLNGVFRVDATNKESLSQIGGMNDFAGVVVCIGDMQTNLITVHNLLELKVQNIFAKAKDSIHKKILEKMNVKNIIFPEEDSAKQLASKIRWPARYALLSLGDATLSEIAVPEIWTGKTISDADIDFRRKFGATVVAIKRTNDNEEASYIMEEIHKEELKEHDELIVFTTRGRLNKLIPEIEKLRKRHKK